METSFWHMAIVGVLITWTTCTFLRAVAARTKQLREQVEAQLAAAEKDDEAAGSREVTTVVSNEPAEVATVLSKPDKPKVGGNGGNSKNHANGKPNGKSNGKGNGHASAGGPRARGR